MTLTQSPNCSWSPSRIFTIS